MVSFKPTKRKLLISASVLIGWYIIILILAFPNLLTCGWGEDTRCQSLWSDAFIGCTNQFPRIIPNCSCCVTSFDFSYELLWLLAPAILVYLLQSYNFNFVGFLKPNFIKMVIFELSLFTLFIPYENGYWETSFGIPIDYGSPTFVSFPTHLIADFIFWYLIACFIYTYIWPKTWSKSVASQGKP
jgi:hypothetical protein